MWVGPPTTRRSAVRVTSAPASATGMQSIAASGSASWTPSAIASAISRVLPYMLSYTITVCMVLTSRFQRAAPLAYRAWAVRP